MVYFGKTSKTFSYFCQVFYKVSFCKVWEIAVKRHHGRWILVTKFLKIVVKNNIFQTWIKSKKKFFILLFFIFENIRCHTCGKMKRKYFLYFEFFIRCLLIVAHFEKLRKKGTSPSQKSDENFKFSPRCQVSENFLFHTLKLYITEVLYTKK